MATGPLFLDTAARSEVCAALLALLERAEEGGAVAPRGDADAANEMVARVLSDTTMTPVAALEGAAEAMIASHVRTAHPRYFGLFTTAPATMAVVADALVSSLNPQLAAYAHSPFAVELEAALVRAFGARFGYRDGEIEGAFTGGGAEAAQTAVAAAMVAAFPDSARKGLRSLPKQPLVYASVEAHPSLVKAARVAGLGDDAVRRVSVDRGWRMKPAALAEAIANDRLAGFAPFLVVATAGTTGTGAIDPLGAVADVAARERCWMHVDAAWGGLAAFAPSLAAALRGCERADSIAFDPHKALFAPLGTGVYLSRRRGTLRAAFGVSTGYTPRDGRRDPYANSLAWSRRFLGLKVFLALAVAGWRGFADAIDRQAALADLLRRRLVETGWRVVSDTPLPLACFVDATRADGGSARFLAAVAARVRSTHDAWVSLVRLASGARALRACVANAATREADVVALVEGLCDARANA